MNYLRSVTWFLFPQVTRYWVKLSDDLNWVTNMTWDWCLTTIFKCFTSCSFGHCILLLSILIYVLLLCMHPSLCLVHFCANPLTLLPSYRSFWRRRSSTWLEWSRSFISWWVLKASGTRDFVHLLHLFVYWDILFSFGERGALSLSMSPLHISRGIY